jgi:hypothetical protein
LRERPVRGELFTAVPITPIVPTLYGISPFRRNVPSAVFLSWLRNKERAGSPSDAPKKNADIANQNNGDSDIRPWTSEIRLKSSKEPKIRSTNIKIPNLQIKSLGERREFFSDSTICDTEGIADSI